MARLGGAPNTQGGAEIGRSARWARRPGACDHPRVRGFAQRGSVGQVGAGTSATVYLNAEQQAATTDEYSTGRCVFTVVGAPLSS
ncbi:hypothetical protein [Mycobacterium botniense]|uniref:hypothetical protein n=1 Tax=Mycobacterium botniense TaxID=84962 RepID=UPI0013D6320C|nr:hypothetical protein [Mycobacterium botniense]